MHPIDEAGEPPGLRPTSAGERIATVDVLRGLAVLGILLVNVELFRGGDVYALLAGRPVDHEGVDATVQFAVGWLAYGKFLSAFALLFGLGAAMMSRRAVADPAGGLGRGLLARRYAVLAVLGVAHMVLLFSGDILLLYALAGLVLLAFVGLRPGVLAAWAAGIGVTFSVLLVGLVGLVELALGELDEAATADPGLIERVEAIERAFTTGGLVEQTVARAGEALWLQPSQLMLLPWVLALFLTGLAAGRAGLHRRLDEPWVGRLAAVVVPVGLLVNLPIGLLGPAGLAVAASDEQVGVATVVAGTGAYLLGAPLLSIGYLATAAWLCRSARVRALLLPVRRLGRMALTGYLLQSLLATGFFVWLGFYGRLGPAASMLVVLAIWVLIATFASAWLARFDKGPVEWAWRRLSYGRRAAPVRGG